MGDARVRCAMHRPSLRWRCFLVAPSVSFCKRLPACLEVWLRLAPGAVGCQSITGSFNFEKILFVLFSASRNR